MKKNLFWSMLAMSGMLFVTSCSQDELVNEAPNADFVNATFTIGAEDIMSTRTATIGDASHVNWVACNVYDVNGVAMDLYEIVPFDQATGKATYNVRLAKGQDYKAAFFAYYGDASGVSAYYDVAELHDINILGGAASNLEERDAFSGFEPIAAADLTNLGTVNKTVTLRRPFAQLNLGIDAAEFEAAQKAGIVVAESAIKVTDVYDAWNALENNIAAGANAVDMEFALNDKVVTSLWADADKNGVDEEYTYLALNYILAGTHTTTLSTTNVEFTWKSTDGKTNSPATTFNHIPVERNHRTNIIGRLLTTPAEFTIIIDAEFDDPDHFEEIQTIVEKTVTNATELQDAIDAAEVGRTIIKIGQDITGGTEIKVNQKKDVEIYIDGQGFATTGTFLVSGASEWNGKESLTIHNLTFRNMADAIVLGKDNATRYAHNVTISDCKFMPIANLNNIAAIRTYQANDIYVINCTASLSHSFAQITGGNNIKFENCSSNCQRGISLGSATNCFVSNCTINATGTDKYGIRHNADSGVDVLKITECTVTATFPVVVRHTNTTAVTDYKLVFEGNNTLNKGAEFEVAIAEEEYDTNGMALTPFAAGTVTVTGANTGWNIFK